MAVVETRGLDEFRAGVHRFDSVVAHALMGVANTTATTLAARIIARARGYGWKHLPTEIRTVHEPDKKAYRVLVEPAAPRPRNLPIWLEYGTSKMVARPFVFPEVGRADREYPAAVERALETAFTVVGG